MTTEVLRNMIYAGSSALDDLGLVVLDEVHFLQDAYRGPVWEEVIIHLPRARPAGVPLGDGEQRDGAGRVDPDGARPDHAGGRAAPAGAPARPLPRRRPDQRPPAPAADVRSTAGPTPRPSASTPRPCGAAGRPRGERPVRGSGRRVLSTPAGVEVVDLLDSRGLLPAIFFIFSRNQCDEAARDRASPPGSGSRPVRSATASARSSTPGSEALADDDLAVLGYGQFLAQLEAGIAAHHAGMVPPFKEAVEACFIEGLIKVVFATETLAVGINMPARTVVIEKLTKFTGDHHEPLTPGEYTQLTGRAGRRGIDEVGHAVVLWSPFVPFEQVAALAGQPDVPPQLGVPADLQHGRQPRRHVHQRAGPPPAQPVLRPVPGRPRRRAHRGPPRARAGRPGRGPRPGGEPATATSRSTAGWLEELRAAPPGPRRRSWPSAWPGSAPATSSTPPRAATAGPSRSSPRPTARAACA